MNSPDTAIDWQSKMDAWSYAYPQPIVSGLVKDQPEDFQVVEEMDVVPTGQGEHIWLLIRKTKQNTEQLAKQLARFTNVAYRDVAYSGLKDFFAITQQWFSIYLPKGDTLDWSLFEMPGVEILEITRHSRKLKRGTHRANHFAIEIKNLSGDLDSLNTKLTHIEEYGVPNYYGPQRFGRGGNNVAQAIDMLQNSTRIKNRNLRSILLSSARSWLFNTIVSARINDQSWQKLWPGEPANLDGTRSIFQSGNEDHSERLASSDIHPTAPLWGEVDEQTLEAYKALHGWELQLMNESSKDLVQGLARARLSYQRRPIRMRVKQMDWRLDARTLKLSFALQKGQFATSVLREIVKEAPIKS